MKRVLFLAYLFPPIANSGTQRPLKFVKFLREYGWDPIVVTASQFHGQPLDPGLLREIPPDVKVIRVPMRNEQVADATAKVLGRRVGDAIRWRMQSSRRSPDLYAWWRPAVINAARKLFRTDGFDAIYATGYPWTSLLAARDIAQLTGRPFVADFRDLWSGESLFRDERPPHEEELALERQVVEDASAVVCASDSISRMLSNSHPSADPDKFVTIYNGFDPADFAVPDPPRQRDRVRIVYTGVWKEGYNPSHLYRSLDWVRRSQEGTPLDCIEVITAGYAPGEARRHGLAKYITELGPIPHADAVALMKSADLLYLSHVDPDRQWVVPGKLYEYLASGTPVLALTDPNRECGRIIRSVGGGVAIPPDDPGHLYYALLEICRTRTIKVPERNDDMLAQFDRRHLAGRLAGVLTDATRRGSRAAASAQAPLIPAAGLPAR